MRGRAALLPARLRGQEPPELVLLGRGVLGESRRGLCGGELRHANGHQQIRVECGWAEATGSFS